MWSGSTGVPAPHKTDNRLSKTKIKCLGQQKAKSLSLEADHHLFFRNTLDLSQVMLTKKKSCAKLSCVCAAKQDSDLFSHMKTQQTACIMIASRLRNSAVAADVNSPTSAQTCVQERR